MAETVEKGITITFRGDTTEFDKGISTINGELKSLKAETKLLNRELKLDPTNIGKLEEKFKTLKNQEKLLTEEIEAYKQAMSGLDSSSKEFQDMDNKVRGLQVDLEYCRKEMQKLGGNEISVMLEGIAKKFESAGEKVQDLGKKFAPISALASGVLGGAVKTAADFEAKMSQVQATMGITSDATSDLNGELVNTKDALGELARQMGSETAFSASECADALNYLALAGYDTQQMADVLPTVLSLASSGALELATASDMVTDAMSALGLGVDDASMMVDQMAKTASSSNTSVGQLGEAILSVGANAKVLKGGTTELNTALGILANSGTKGAEGGTALRNVILALTSPTDKAANRMKKLGVEVFDSEGNMRGLNDVLGDLNKSMDGMSDSAKADVLGDIFNKATLSDAKILIEGTGAAWDELSAKIQDSGGFASQTSATQLDNLNGQITILKSGIEGMAISLGNALLPVIKKVTDFIQGLVDKFNSLDEGTKTTIATVLAVVAAVAPVLMVIGGALKTIGTVITAISTVINILIPIVQGFLTFLTTANPFGLIVVGVTLLATAIYALWENNESFRTAVMNVGSYLKDKFQAIIETISDVVSVLVQWFKDAWSAVGDLWTRFQETEFIQTLIGYFESLRDILMSVVEWLKSAWEWLGNVMTSVGDFLASGIQTIGGWFGSGGFGNGGAYQSGGYGTLEFATTINITNNGANLTSAQAQQFGRQIVEYVNDKLGRRI